MVETSVYVVVQGVRLLHVLLAKSSII